MYRKTKLLDIIVFLSILNSGSLFVKNFNDDIFYLLELLLVVLFFVKNKNKNYTNINHFTIFTFLIFIHAMIYTSGIYSYIGLLVKVISIFLLASIIRPEIFWEKYNKIIVIISVLSLIGFVIINSLPSSIIQQLGEKYVLNDLGWGIGKLWYYNLFFITWPNISMTAGAGQSIDIIRNQSIFWEPGAFQFFVNLALLMNIRFTHKLLSKRNIIYIITILTTFSTTGYFVLILILLDQLRIRKIFLFRLKYFAAAVFSILISITIFNLPAIQNKFDVTAPEFRSFTARMYHTEMALKMIIDNPISGFGYGEQSIKSISKYSEALSGNPSKGGTNHLLTYLGQFGLIIGLLYLAPLYFTRSYMRHLLLYVMVLTLILSTEHFVTCHIILAMIYLKPFCSSSPAVRKPSINTIN